MNNSNGTALLIALIALVALGAATLYFMQMNQNEEASIEISVPNGG